MELVSLACMAAHEKRLRQKSSSGTKCERIKNELYGKKDYLSKKNIYEARLQYKTRFGLLPFAGNYSNDRRFARTDWMCRCGTEREVEGHIVSGKCPVYGDLRGKFGDLNNDQNLVDFFREVLARRDELEEEEKKK